MTASMLNTAKVFTTGRSQAVRLPKAFRFATAEVTIERQGDAVILRPKPDDTSWAQKVMAAVAAFESGPKLARSEEWTQVEREPLLP